MLLLLMQNAAESYSKGVGNVESHDIKQTLSVSNLDFSSKILSTNPTTRSHML